MQKESSTFPVLDQKFRGAEGNFLALLENKVEEQEKEISTFIGNFKTMNDRFLKTVVMGEQGLSEEERELLNHVFEKRNGQIETIVNSVREKRPATTEEILHSPAGAKTGGHATVADSWAAAARRWILRGAFSGEIRSESEPR